MYALDFLYVYALFKFMFLIYVVENPIATRVRVSCIGGLLCASNSGRTRKRLTWVSTASGGLRTWYQSRIDYRTPYWPKSGLESILVVIKEKSESRTSFCFLL